MDGINSNKEIALLGKKNHPALDITALT